MVPNPPQIVVEEIKKQVQLEDIAEDLIESQPSYPTITTPPL